MGLKRTHPNAALTVPGEEDRKRQRENVEVNRPPIANELGECTICRSLLIQKCIQCTAGGATSGSTCVLSFGACGCVFHHHCVGQWLYKSYVCPVHETPWSPCQARPFCCEPSSSMWPRR
uniref:Zinc finger RING-H2-type domain-containing protein n=1 Tax=Prymnesium polylepis TaxID=72548 RepID=A0A6V4UEJ2_9EUKA|mmetsp:Transcript_20726/g.55757  ORF Transcript_20726/g.55757 Transcript_20726/m.55757 type:complete len:120 (+) Transcript_20726:125-484(+)